MFLVDAQGIGRIVCPQRWPRTTRPAGTPASIDLIGVRSRGERPFADRRKPAKASTAKAVTIMAHVDNSGTAPAK